MLNRLFDADEVIGDDVVYVGADGIRAPTVGNAGGWKNGGGGVVDCDHAGAALDGIG